MNSSALRSSSKKIKNFKKFQTLGNDSKPNFLKKITKKIEESKNKNININDNEINIIKTGTQI